MDEVYPGESVSCYLMHEATATRTGIKVRNPFLFRLRRRVILKGQNSALGIQNLTV